MKIITKIKEKVKNLTLKKIIFFYLKWKKLKYFIKMLTISILAVMLCVLICLLASANYEYDFTEYITVSMFSYLVGINIGKFIFDRN